MRVELSRRGIQGKCELDGDYPALEVHFMYSGRFGVVSVYITRPEMGSADVTWYGESRRVEAGIDTPPSVWMTFIECPTVADGFVRCQFMLPRLLEAL
jgi:hypothetical protein